MKNIHYKNGKIEPITFINANQLNFVEGNIIKYLCRYKYKGTPIDDLIKLKDYVDILIEDFLKNYVVGDNMNSIFTFREMLEFAVEDFNNCYGYNINPEEYDTLSLAKKMTTLIENEMPDEDKVEENEVFHFYKYYLKDKF